MKIIRSVLRFPIYIIGFVVGFVSSAYYQGEHEGNNFQDYMRTGLD